MIEENEKSPLLPRLEGWVQEIPVCPICGSERRFFEGIGEELKQRGLFPAEMKSYYEMRTGAFGNQEIMAKIPIGDKLPAFSISTDVCLGYPDKPCGNIYAVRIERTNAQKVEQKLAPVLYQPNRQQRRHGAFQGWKDGGNGGQHFNLVLPGKDR